MLCTEQTDTLAASKRQVPVLKRDNLQPRKELDRTDEKVVEYYLPSPPLCLGSFESLGPRQCSLLHILRIRLPRTFVIRKGVAVEVHRSNSSSSSSSSSSFKELLESWLESCS